MTLRPKPLRPLGCHSVWKMSRRVARTTNTPTQVMTQPATFTTVGGLPAGPQPPRRGGEAPQGGWDDEPPDAGDDPAGDLHHGGEPASRPAATVCRPASA